MNESSLSTYTPSELILARSQAFSRGDFGFIYDSCHSESNFRRQFVERNEYLQFGQTNLVHDYQIINCQVLVENVEAQESQVIFLMKMKVQGQVQRYAERAWLLWENKAWRYHRGQKINEEDFPESPESINIADFAKLDPATIF